MSFTTSRRKSSYARHLARVCASSSRLMGVRSHSPALASTLDTASPDLINGHQSAENRVPAEWISNPLRVPLCAPTPAPDWMPAFHVLPYLTPYAPRSFLGHAQLLPTDARSHPPYENSVSFDAVGDQFEVPLQWVSSSEGKCPVPMDRSTERSGESLVRPDA